MSEILMRVTWVDYTPKKDEGDKPTVRVCGRSADGDRMVRHVRGCYPHFFIPADVAVPESDEWEILATDKGYETYDGTPVQRVVVSHPKQVKRFKESDDAPVKTYEADIPFYRRATWDYGLSGYIRVPQEGNIHVDDIETDIESTDVDTIEPRVVIGDIEVLPDGDKTFDEMTEAVEDPVVACTLYDSFTEDILVAVIDDESAEGSDVKEEVYEHLGDHELRDLFDETDIRYLRCESEADLLNEVIGQIEKWRPDLISGWNWIDFDHQYLTDRAREVDGVTVHALSDIGGVGGRKIETVVKGVSAFDELAAFDDKISWSENRSLSLEYVASEEIGIGKVEAVDVKTAYETDRARLAAYNLLDVLLCVGITKKHEIESFYFDLAELSGIQVYDAFYEKRLVDGWIASRKDDDQILPNQKEREIPEPAGGLVLSPSDGVTENVAVFDLKSLYPSSALTCNISPETMVDDPKEADVVIPGMPEKETDVGGSIEPSDVNWDNWDDDLPWSQRPKGFTFDEQGILAEAMEGPFKERERYKNLRNQFDQATDRWDVYDRKQGSVKVVHNSMYGVINSPYYRLARPGIGDAITGISRYILWRAAEWMEEHGYEVIYGDTDSLVVRMESYEEGRKLDEYILDAKGLNNQLNTHMKEVAADLGLPEEHPFIDAGDMPHELPDDANHLWYFEFEKFYSSFLQAGSKKRYAGDLAWKDGEKVPDDKPPDIVGFESQRSDVPKKTEEVQTSVIKRVLNQQDFSTVSNYIRDQIEQIREQANLDEIGIPKSIGKPLNEYTNMPRVRAAQHSNRHLEKEYGPGDTPWMFYVSRTPVGVEGTDVIAIDWNEDIPEGYEVDEETTIVKSFESALDPVISELGWEFAGLRSGKRARSAEEEVDYSGDPFASSPEGSDESEEDETDEDWTGAEAW